MTIEFREDAPPIDKYWMLFETTGWNHNYQATPGELAQAIASSWQVIVAYDGDRLIGFGRIVSDCALHAMIYDLIVVPDYQNQGIGTRILEMLVKKCQDANIRDIQLFCARGKREFYEKRGFVVRPEDAPGMQLRRG